MAEKRIQTDILKLGMPINEKYTDSVSVRVQSTLRLILLNNCSIGIYHCNLLVSLWTKLKLTLVINLPIYKAHLSEL